MSKEMFLDWMLVFLYFMELLPHGQSCSWDSEFKYVVLSNGVI